MREDRRDREFDSVETDVRDASVEAPEFVEVDVDTLEAKVEDLDRVVDADSADDEHRPSTAEEIAEQIADFDDVSDDDDVNDRGEIRLPEDVEYSDLDAETRAGLRSLPKGLAENVGLRLVAAGQLVDVDPKRALEHALVARRMASRIGVVREAAGVAAYFAEEWQTAISELRTAQRLTGTKSHLALIADSERALGRPERAVDMYREVAEADSVEPEVLTELLIVAAGARRDLGQGGAGVSMLQVPELKDGAEPHHVRLRFAYAEALAAEGRMDEAREWFERVAASDPDDELGAGERLLELDGVGWVADPDDE